LFIVIIIKRKEFNVKSKLYEQTENSKNYKINTEKNIVSSPTSSSWNNTPPSISKEHVSPILDNTKIKRKEFYVKSKLYNVTESAKQRQYVKKEIIIEQNKINYNNWNINNKIINNDIVTINRKLDKRKSFPNVKSNIFKTTASFEISKATSRKPIEEKRELIIIPFSKNNNNKIINSNEDKVEEKADDVDGDEEYY
jgi:hypothetical protein